jgi:hypothetical protein
VNRAEDCDCWREGRERERRRGKGRCLRAGEAA